MNLLRETRDFRRKKKDVITYAENRNYYPYLEGLIHQLDGNVSYVTSDSEDSSMKDAFYLNKLLPAFMAVVNCKVFVMTMTDLNSFYIRRSFQPVHYVYVFHSLVSTHMIYRQEAFDHYDSVLCVGPHQVEEIRRHEKLYGLKPKKLIEAGYYRLERLYRAYKSYRKENDKVTVLIAPTWGPSNLLNVYGNELVKILLSEGYDVILRLHPETVKRHQFLDYENVTLETSVVNMNSLVRADILITDWSGIGLKYAFGTERPVVFIDTPRKVRNSNYEELGTEPIESSTRSEIGVVVPPNNLSSLTQTISELLTKSANYRKRIIELRSKYVFNFGHSAEVGANYIKEML